MIYDTQCVNPNTTHQYINQIHPNLQLNPTHENNNCINFLDLLIIRTHPPTQPGNRYIPETHNHQHSYQLPIQHPTEQKIAAYRYHINRMQSLPLTIERQQTEWNTIKTMAQNNNFPENP